MPLSEIPLAALFVLFLTTFVLIGIYPAVKRTVAKIRKRLDSIAQQNQPMAALLDNVHAELFASPSVAGPLNDFEIIVLRRLARAGGKALSRKQVNAPLHFGNTTLQKTLRSLNRRGLLQLKVSFLLGPRFALSKAGRNFAIEQGYILQIHASNRRSRRAGSTSPLS